MKVHPMWDDYPALSKELSATVSLIKKQVTIQHPEINQKINQMLTGGGKLLRPAYSILFSQFGDSYDAKKSQAVAAAVEIIHTATLIHDDVIDESSVRRGQSSINAAYSNRIAVYTGDYLFTLCFQLLQEYVEDASVIQLNAKGMEVILMGELNQLTNKYNTNMRMRDYFRQIKGKTAELFGLSCFSGAYHATKDQKFAEQAYRIGHNIGVAFQLIDDVLDYTEESEQLGKPALQDLRNGIYTAPLIYAMRNNRPAIEPLLANKEEIHDDEVAQVLQIIQQAGGIEETRLLAQKYTKKALKQIQNLPNIEAKHILSNITEQVLNRNF